MAGEQLKAAQGAYASAAAGGTSAASVQADESAQGFRVKPGINSGAISGMVPPKQDADTSDAEDGQ